MLKKIKKNKLKIFCYSIIILTFGLVIYTSHIFTPLKLINITEKKFRYIGEVPIKIDKSNVLDKTCYIGDIGEEIDNREMYIGVLNYLCKEFEEKYVFIKSEKAGKTMQKSNILATTLGLFNITFYSDNIKEYGMKEDIEIARVVFHEYIHLLMFRHMSNGFTVENKSKELINSISSKYDDLTDEELYPSTYAKTSYKEQIAEIIGIYLARKTEVTDIIIVSNFEEDMYRQFILNIKD